MLFASIFAGNVHAQQPYGACWHPEDIKNWSPETDPDAKFNRSTVNSSSMKGRFVTLPFCIILVVYAQLKVQTILPVINLLIGNTWTKLYIGQDLLRKVLLFLLPHPLSMPLT